LIELRQHPTSNRCILNLLPLPSSDNALQLKYKKPQNSTWKFSDIDKCIQFVVTNKEFGSIIGFEDKTYPEVLTNDKKVKFISSFAPKTNIINNLILTCNLLSSVYYNPINIFSSK
jgi:hypothetical protein